MNVVYERQTTQVPTDLRRLSTCIIIFVIMTDDYYYYYYIGSFSGGGVYTQNSKVPGGSHFVNYTLVARTVKAAFHLLGRQFMNL